MGPADRLNGEENQPGGEGVSLPGRGNLVSKGQEVRAKYPRAWKAVMEADRDVPGWNKGRGGAGDCGQTQVTVVPGSR